MSKAGSAPVTPSERIDAAAAEWNDSFMDVRWSELSEEERTVHRQVVRRALDAADEAVPMVPVRELEAVRQAGRIWLDRGEEMEKRAERAEAAARDFARALRRVCQLGEGLPDPTTEWLVASNALSRHPSFSGEEGTE